MTGVTFKLIRLDVDCAMCMKYYMLVCEIVACLQE